MFQNSTKRRPPCTSFLELEQAAFGVMGCPGEVREVLEAAFSGDLHQKKTLIVTFCKSFVAAETL